MTPYLIAAVVLGGPPALYFAWRSREFRKFLAGAFFVSGGVQLYLYLTGVSVPILGTSAVQDPELSAGRGVLHLVLFALCLYTGFIRKAKPPATS